MIRNKNARLTIIVRIIIVIIIIIIIIRIIIIIIIKKKKKNRRAAAPAPAPLLEAVAGPALSGRLSIFVLCLCQLCPVSFWMPCLPHVVGRRGRSPAWTRKSWDKAPLEPYFVQHCPASHIFEDYFVRALSRFFFDTFFFHKI